MTDWTRGPTVYKPCTRRDKQTPYLLKKFRSFNLCSKMLEILYQSVIARVIYFSALCKVVGVRVEGSINARRINKIIHKVGTITVQNQNVESERNRRSLNTRKTADNPRHLLHSTLSRQQSPISLRFI